MVNVARVMHLDREKALGGRRRRVQATGDLTTVGTFQRLWDRFLWDEAKSPKIFKRLCFMICMRSLLLVSVIS
jgi:hypothetical protein